jgi:flagellar motor switch protein FliN/FliY
VSADNALLRLADSTADAVAGVLEQFCPGGVERGQASVSDAPFASVPTPSVATNVSYVDGATGGNVFTIAFAGARKLAAAMMGTEPDADAASADELTELELSAVGEAANQMMAAAAAATSAVIGQAVDISPPETRYIHSADGAESAFGKFAHATTVSFTLLGEPCRLIQLVPNAFVVRLDRALQELDSQAAPLPTGEGGFSPDAFRDVPVRVWAELGRVRMPIGQLVGLPAGAVVELDAAADEPVDLYVNGRRFARGRLQLEDGEWAVQVETVLSLDDPLAITNGGDH